MCSRHSVTQFASLQIDLLNIKNNWRTYMRGVEQKHRLCRQPLWWLRHCFSAFKVSAKNGLFLGQMTGRHLSGA
jgi:hypothetical protein